MRSQAILSAMAIGLGLTWAPVAQAQKGPSFDCAKASHEIEVLICKDEALAALDRKMAQTYAASIRVLGKVADSREATRTLRAYQSGWSKGRNDCWKETDKRLCTETSYKRRIAELQAHYGLVKSSKPVFYACENNPSNEIVATFFETDPASVRLERGDQQTIGIAAPAATGVRYEADFGTYFWTKGDEALAEWPQGSELKCEAAAGAR